MQRNQKTADYVSVCLFKHDKHFACSRSDV